MNITALGEATMSMAAEIVYWERPAGGHVFVIGNILAALHALEDRRLATLVFNAVDHFIGRSDCAHQTQPTATGP